MQDPDDHDLNQIWKSFLWHVRGSHDIQLLQVCNFLMLWEFEQTNPKIPIIGI